MATLKIWIAETRPSFLLLTPICVIAGIAAVIHDGISLNIPYLVLVFVGALCAHIAVNVLNDYFDYKSGIDLRTTRTPFSGGSGILPEASLTPREVLFLGLGSLAIVILIGIYFITVYGRGILPIGIAGVFLVSLYTPVITKVAGFSEIAAGGFALIALGTYFIQSGSYSASAIISTAVAWLLIANLLLLNEIPDAEADKVGGRKHLPITLGKATAARIYCATMVITYTLIMGGVIAAILPLAALLGFLTLPLGIRVMSGVLKNHDKTEALVPFLSTNVLVVLMTPLMMSVGVMIQAFID